MAELLYQGHGSFRLTTDEKKVIYIDPFAGTGYDPPADLILVSHEHRDHNMTELVAKKENTVILRSGDFLKDGRYLEVDICGVVIKGVPAYNKNHPIDKCVGFVIKADGLSLYFAGDTSTTGAMKDILPAMKIDYAFLPTDGIYNMGVKEASRAAALIGAKHTVPVHMKPGALFSEEVAQEFACDGKLIIRAGESVRL